MDRDKTATFKGLETTIVHEGIHRWDFRGQHYFQGPDIAHPFTRGLQDILSGKLTSNYFSQYTDIAPTISAEHKLKIFYDYQLHRYHSTDTLDWNHYFEEPLAFEEFGSVPSPETFERLTVDGGILLDIYMMHGEAGLQGIFDAIETLRTEDLQAWENADLSIDAKRNRWMRLIADGLQVNVTPYFEYWKYPISPEQRTYFATYEASPAILDTDRDGFSPLEHDLDDTDATVYPGAPELLDGKDNNQDGLSDEHVISEVDGDLPDSGMGPEGQLPLLVRGAKPDLDDVDMFHINLTERTLINVLFTSLNGNRLCEFPDANALTLFSARINVNGGFLTETDVFSGENNNNVVRYFDPGEYVFTVSNESPYTCPGEYQIQLFESNATPETITRGELSYTSKVYDGLSANPSFDLSDVRGTSTAEAEYLRELFLANEGVTWEQNAGWLATSDICYWSGVHCDKLGISGLDLSFNRRLKGAIPGDIVASLPHLRKLRIENANAGLDALPNNFGDWRNLSFLELKFSNVRDTLPGAVLADKQRLYHLSFAGNQFFGSVPGSWSDIPNLTHLDLTDNDLTGALPADFNRLPLKTFYFDTDELCVPNQSVLNWLNAIPEVSNREYSTCHATPLPFAMLGPSIDTVDVEASPNSEFSASWASSLDPEGESIAYSWMLNRVNSDGEFIPLFETQTGADTVYTTTSAAIGTLLSDDGLTGSVDVAHYAVASDGDFEAVSDTLYLTVKVEGTSSLEDVAFSRTVRVYPNPASTEIIVRSSGKDLIKRVDIFDLQGRLLRSGSELKVDVSTLPAGAVTVTCRSMGGRVASRRVVIKR